MLLFFEDSPRVWRLREPRKGEEGGLQDVPPDRWKRLVYPDLKQYPAKDWPEVEDRPMTFSTLPIGAIFGVGDTTTTIYDENDPTQRYRFTEGTKSGQKAEIRRRMEERFQRDNKAPWNVGVDVAYD